MRAAVEPIGPTATPRSCRTGGRVRLAGLDSKGLFRILPRRSLRTGYRPMTESTRSRTARPSGPSMARLLVSSALAIGLAGCEGGATVATPEARVGTSPPAATSAVPAGPALEGDRLAGRVATPASSAPPQEPSPFRFTEIA